MYVKPMNRETEQRRERLPALEEGVNGSSDPHAMVRAIEASVLVQRRFQFFVWAQSHLGAMVRHQLVVCGAYQRVRRDLVFEAFNSIVVPAQLLALVTDRQSALMRHLIDAWVAKRGGPLLLRLPQDPAGDDSAAQESLFDLGFESLLAHGVSRPQRPSELESFFVLGLVGRCFSAREQTYLELMLPHVHSAWLRVQNVERELSGNRELVSSTRGAFARPPITGREGQILGWVREGLSNQEIGIQLGISALTVKNHVQKILQKLGASNRAQAVAKAMARNLIDSQSSQGDGETQRRT
jgi:transcriptional regulator EpsA